MKIWIQFYFLCSSKDKYTIQTAITTTTLAKKRNRSLVSTTFKSAFVFLVWHRRGVSVAALDQHLVGSATLGERHKTQPTAARPDARVVQICARQGTTATHAPSSVCSFSPTWLEAFIFNTCSSTSLWLRTIKASPTFARSSLL